MLLIILGVLILRTYYNYSFGVKQKKVTTGFNQGKRLYKDIGSFQDVWCVYWDNDIATTLTNYKEQWESIILFACYYNENDQIYIPESMKDLNKKIILDNKNKKYLSIVNDIQLKDGTSIQKDAELLTRLFSDENKMKVHIFELLDLIEEWNCQGIEIDYEKIDTPELWQAYIRFINLLWKEASARNIDVRIVLGSHAPVESYDFPEGPEYIVMCYNLYGYHSGPGPKADRVFLKETVKRFNEFSDIKYALANGGFDWNAEEKVYRALKESEVLALIKEHNSRITRDKKSAALTFHYQGEDGIHTVWYADDQTLYEWQSAIKDATGKSVKFCLWRLEGNE